MRRRLLFALLPTLLLFTACDARQQYPPGTTDVGLWSGPNIRENTEVPNQYPNGTTRDLPDLATGGSEGDDDH